MFGIAMVLISLFLLLGTSNKGKANNQRIIIRNSADDDLKVTKSTRGSRRHY